MNHYDIEIHSKGRISFVPKDPALAQRRVEIDFMRTLRLPDDGKTYPLPPGLGRFPVCRVDDYAGKVPAPWVEHGGVFLPMYQREAMWLSFRHTPAWSPAALKIAAGKINAVSGELWTQELVQRAAGGKQDYLVVPNQPWIDGFNAGEGRVRQFVAMPLGMGYTAEAQLTGKEDVGGIQILCFAPVSERFPEPKRSVRLESLGGLESMTKGITRGGARGQSLLLGAVGARSQEGAEMGLAGGGWMTQKLYKDPHGLGAWDVTKFGRCFIHIVNSTMWKAITGEDAPDSPVSAAAYTAAGYPWFSLYDEKHEHVAASNQLAGLSSVAQKDQQHGFVNQQDNSSINVPDQQVTKLEPTVPESSKVRDGNW